MQPTQPAEPNKLSPEKAAEIMKNGKVRMRDGVLLHVFKPMMNSELPTVKTEELLGHDIVVLAVKGEIKGEFGPSWVVEIATKHGPAEFAWFVNQTGVLGKQLRQMMDNKALPFWCSVHEQFPANGGQRYHTFDTPGVVTDALPKAHDDPDGSDPELPW